MSLKVFSQILPLTSAATTLGLSRSPAPRPYPAGNQDAGQDCGKARPHTQNKGPQERADRSNYE